MTHCVRSMVLFAGMLAALAGGAPLAGEEPAPAAGEEQAPAAPTAEENGPPAPLEAREYDFGFLQSPESAATSWPELGPWFSLPGVSWRPWNLRRLDNPDLLAGALRVVRYWTNDPWGSRLDVRDHGMVIVTAPAAAQARCEAFRRALDEAARVTHEAQIAFIRPGEAERAAAFSTPAGVARLVADGEAAALIRGAVSTRAVAVTACDDAWTLLASENVTTHVMGYEAKVDEGASVSEPQTGEFRVGARAFVRVSRLSAGGGSVVRLVARISEPAGDYRKVAVSGGMVELPRDRSLYSGSEFVIPDGRAAVVGARVLAVEAESLPTFIVIRVRSKGGATVAAAGDAGAVLRLSPLRATRMLFFPVVADRHPEPMSSMYDGGWANPPQVAPESELSLLARALVKAGGAPGMAPVGGLYALTGGPEIDPEAARGWLRAREAGETKQFALNAWLVEGLSTDVSDGLPARLTPEKLAEVLNAGAAPPGGGPVTRAAFGALCLAHGEAVLAAETREMIVSGHEAYLSTGVSLFQPVLDQRAAGVNLHARLRGEAGKEVLADLRLEAAAIDRMERIDLGQMAIDRPVARFIATEHRVAIEPGSAVVLPAGVWKSADSANAAPLALIVSLTALP
ncbi:MAG: hypothetical protein HY719_11850 [Planctomycetes bacterium]|nr:hypothetical protein [Planctomycetota bacterium]